MMRERRLSTVIKEKEGPPLTRQDKGLWEYLVQKSELSSRVFGVCWVDENAPVQQSAMYICHHAANVPRRLGLAL